MDELNAAAPSSTEPTAEELASIAMGTNAQEAGAAAAGEPAPITGLASEFHAAGDAKNPNVLAADSMASTEAPAVAASGESTAAAPDAGAAADLSAPSGSAEIAVSTPSQVAADAEGAASGEGVASAAGASPIDDSGSATAAFTGDTSLPSEENSLAERIVSLPHRVAMHLESIYELVADHARQLDAPAGLAKSELALEIDDLLHKLSNGIAVSDGRIVAKLAALRAML